MRAQLSLLLALFIGCGGNDADERTTIAESTASPAAAPSAQASSVAGGSAGDPVIGEKEGAPAEGAGGAPEASGAGGEGKSLDLREANVTAVKYDATSGRFDVTLLHDDDGEPAYANWWQVEKLDGTLLGRRELLHAHGTYEFTRSKSIEVPAGIEWVVVRGHDPTHGYGGQAIVFNLKTAEARKVDQGSEKQDFSSFEP